MSKAFAAASPSSPKAFMAEVDMFTASSTVPSPATAS